MHKYFQLETLFNLFPLEIIQKCQFCQLCVLPENSSVLFHCDMVATMGSNSDCFCTQFLLDATSEKTSFFFQMPVAKTLVASFRTVKKEFTRRKAKRRTFHSNNRYDTVVYLCRQVFNTVQKVVFDLLQRFTGYGGCR